MNCSRCLSNRQRKCTPCDSCLVYTGALLLVALGNVAQIGCLGRHLVSLIEPWSECGRAVAIDSTILRARGGVWHQKQREKGELPHTSIDTQAHWTKSGWHGWVYGWKLHVVSVVAAVWLP